MPVCATAEQMQQTHVKENELSDEAKADSQLSAATEYRVSPSTPDSHVGTDTSQTVDTTTYVFSFCCL